MKKMNVFKEEKKSVEHLWQSESFITLNLRNVFIVHQTINMKKKDNLRQ